MDTATSTRPKTMAELLPGLSSILSKDSIQTLTAKKQPRQTIAGTRTAEKVTKPLTLAEMRADLLPLKVQSPRMQAQGAPSTNKKNWNSSVKVDGKIISHTAHGQMKNNPVRKVLNFQPKSKTLPKSTLAEETKFFKPEMKAKKSLRQLNVRSNARISGVASISDTPVVNIPSRTKFTHVNNNQKKVYNSYIGKENTPLKDTVKKPVYAVTDSPLSNHSWKSSGDTSFLLNEKEINDQIQELKALKEKLMSHTNPSVPTPVKESKTDQEYIYSEDVYEDAAKMSSGSKIEVGDKAVVSLADLLENNSSIFEDREAQFSDVDLLQWIEKATLKQMNVIDNTVESLIKLKKSQVCVLNYVKTLLEKQIKIEKSMPQPIKTSIKDVQVVKIYGSSQGVVGQVTVPETIKENKPNDTSIAEAEQYQMDMPKSQNDKLPDYQYEVKIMEKLQPLPNNISAPTTVEVSFFAKDPKSIENSKNYELKELHKVDDHGVTDNAEDVSYNTDVMQEMIMLTPKALADTDTTNTMKLEYSTIKYESKLQPSYKIPSKRKICLRKKLLRNSMNNAQNNFETPVKSNISNQALSMYMNMKKHMNFLNTPNVKVRLNMLDSPSITSFNLQNQLDDLYGGS